MKKVCNFICEYYKYITILLIGILVICIITKTCAIILKEKEQDLILYSAWLKAHHQENLSYEEWKLLRLNGLLPK